MSKMSNTSDEITRRTFLGTTAIVVLGPVVDAQRAPDVVGMAGMAGIDRKALTAAVDCIIPAGDRMPSASAAGAVRYLERLAAREAELAQQFSRALAVLGAGFSGFSEAQQVEAMRTLERTDAPAFAAFRDAVYEAYYTNPVIWPRLGYTFRKGLRKTAALDPFDPGQLARVQQLPKMYRDAD
jgi:hypothetical protein